MVWKAGGVAEVTPMCQLCDDNNGEMQSCQDCGRLICFDESPDSVDVIDRAYVTASGDLFCTRCGRKHDARAEEAEEALCWEDLEDPFDDGGGVEEEENT
jgi:hypothetical protein